jgi:nucleotide-binding universal stress UspA family protein
MAQAVTTAAGGQAAAGASVAASAGGAAPGNVAAPRKRRSYESGHKPKFLVVLDETQECDRAVYFASRRAARVGAVVIMLRVIEPGMRNQVWLKVAEIMRAEELEQAHAMLEKYAARAKEVAGVAAEGLIREGDKAAEILRVIEADEDIAAIVLAAGTEKEGPGLLVTELARTAGNYPIPIAIVPGHLSDAELDALS